MIIVRTVRPLRGLSTFRFQSFEAPRIYTSPASSHSRGDKSSHSSSTFIIPELTLPNLLAALCGGLSAKFCLDTIRRRGLLREEKETVDETPDLQIVPRRMNAPQQVNARLLIEVVEKKMIELPSQHPVIRQSTQPPEKHRSSTSDLKQETASSEERISNSVMAFLHNYEGAYWNTIGVSQLRSDTDGKCLESFRIASELGYAPALFNLALCYHLGIQVEPDSILAERYYMLAAAKGHTPAIYNLSLLYLRRFVKTNAASYVYKAKALLRLSSSKGHEPSASLLAAIQNNIISKINIHSKKLLECLFKLFHIQISV